MKRIVFFFYIFVIFLFTGCGENYTNNLSPTPYSLKSFNPYLDGGFEYEWHIREVSTDIEQKYNILDDANVGIMDAWNFSRGEDVKIAIIDYDFNVDNVEISSNIVATYNVSNDTTNVKLNKDAHGTACASIIAAANNGLGIVGVAPKAKLILISADLTKDEEKIKAFKKAKELGADVISCSWSFINGVSDELKEVIKELYEDNITIVFASGNNHLDLDEEGYENEAELPWVIGVGATTEENKKADYSNYGKNIDILAPGGREDGGIYCVKGYYDSTYGFFAGTSAAAPIVAGIVALIKSINPDFTPDQIKDIITSTATKIEEEVADYGIDGLSKTHGYGKINAYKAVLKAYQITYPL